jgi:hypothetical protein
MRKYNPPALLASYNFADLLATAAGNFCSSIYSGVC